jgi:hypothetical protein
LNPNSSLKFEKQFSAAPIIFDLAHLGSPSQFSFDFHRAGPEAFGLRPNNWPTQPKAVVSFLQLAVPPLPLLAPSCCAPLSLSLPHSDEDEAKRRSYLLHFPHQSEAPPTPLPLLFDFVMEATKAHTPATIEPLRPVTSPPLHPYKREPHYWWSLSQIE